ncbi:MAG: hypothetical protein E6212_10500 [Actinomyces sp.]|nr:hypothetical protein [Actinomyces sp.]
MPIAINGNVNGTQIWVPDHHWWDYPDTWRLPKRPEDGQLDWERLFPHQRDVVRRFSSILRTLWGLPPELPPVPYQPFGCAAHRLRGRQSLVRPARGWPPLARQSARQSHTSVIHLGQRSRVAIHDKKSPT